MAETIQITLPDGSTRDLPAGSTVLDVAAAIGPRLAKDTVAGEVDGQFVDLRTRLTAPADNPQQDLYVSADLPQTGRVMVKDEDVCIHCGLCAERCPTGAWDMQKSKVRIPYAVDS